VAITGETGGNDSFGSSFSTGADGCGAWLAMGTSAVAAGLGAGGKAASADGGLTVVTVVEGGVEAVFRASVTGAKGVGFIGVSVTAARFVGLLDTGPATGPGVFVTFAAVVGTIAVVVVVVVVLAIGAGAFDVAGVTGPDAGLIASVEISARRTPAAVVSLFMTDAIISAAGFVAATVVGVGVGAGAGAGAGVWVSGGAAA
jgi:hypothetical protein